MPNGGIGEPLSSDSPAITQTDKDLLPFLNLVIVPVIHEIHQYNFRSTFFLFDAYDVLLVFGSSL